MYWWHPNQAHNGYIEVYLNLGLVGVFLLGMIIFRAYAKIRRNFHIDLDCGRLEIMFLITLLLYNFTDAGFRAFGFTGFIFYLIVMDRPLVKS